MPRTSKTKLSLAMFGGGAILQNVGSGVARDAVAPLVPGGRVFGFTAGQFSQGDLLGAVLDKTGPADVDVCTWTINLENAERLRRRIASGGVLEFRLIVNRSLVARKPHYTRKIIDAFGLERIRFGHVHAKYALVRAGDWRIVLRSSMNFNVNQAIESFELDDDPAMFEFVRGHVDELWRLTPASENLAHGTSETIRDVVMGVESAEEPKEQEEEEWGLGDLPLPDFPIDDDLWPET